LPGSRTASVSSRPRRSHPPRRQAERGAGQRLNAPVELPAFLTRRPTGFYRSLNPTTKLVIALAMAAVAFAVREWTGPIVTVALVVAIAVTSRIARRTIPFALATIPLVASILLVNTFLYPGAHDVLFTLGPFTATATGLAAALQATLRVVAFALSVAVFSLTTSTDDLLSDLERRGLGRRAVFVIGSAIGMVPRMIERAGEITDSQRARGLDTEGSIWRRVRGVLPLAGPMISGALSEVEERTLALEARGFAAPPRRTVLRRFPDSSAERALRWGIGVGSATVIALALTGRLILP
jgi:energy-coupling factor transport system permease protein